MKKILLLTIALLSMATLPAQTQQGYVKTKGRLAADGKTVIHGTRIDNVSLQVKGRSQMVKSRAQGTFSFPVPANQFYLTKVYKEGYLLVDADALTRAYHYTTDPLIIVMEQPAVQAKDELDAERKLRRTLQRQVQQKADVIDSLVETNSITQEQYRQLLNSLNKQRDDNEKLITEMAERYAKIDYDQLDDFWREFHRCLLDGNFRRADSLINSRGNIQNDIEALHRLQSANEQEAAELNRRQENLAKSQSFAQHSQGDIAQRCYAKFESFKLQNQFDSAAYYIELRASLDTSMVGWQQGAAEFIREYLADYNKALVYFNTGLRNAIALYGANSDTAALCYNNIGVIYDDQDNYEQAMDHYNKALNIWKENHGENHPEVATSYNNIGNIYAKQGDYKQALDYYNKALSIREKLYGENHPDVAISYNSIGYIYEMQGNYKQAMVYYNKALNIKKKFYGENHPSVAVTYNNMGVAYDKQGDYKQALDYYNKALSIMKNLYGENHPDVARRYINIGSVYGDLDKYQQALEYYNKALSIDINIYGENHPDVASIYNNIGGVYDGLGEYKHALEYYNKALNIRRNFYGENHTGVAECYNNIGYVYEIQGDYKQALEYYNKALVIWKKVHGEGHPNVAIGYNNLGHLYDQQGEYEKALEYYNKSLMLRINAYGENHPAVAISYNNIGSIYVNQGSYERALEYLNKALVIWKNKYGEDNSTVSQFLGNIGYIYNELGDYNQALDCFNKALTIKKNLYGKYDPVIAFHTYVCYQGLLKDSLRTDSVVEAYEDFMAPYVLTASVIAGGPAAQDGLSDEYYLLELGEWNIDSDRDLQEVVNALRGKSKDITLMDAEGNISQHHYEDKIGVNYMLEHVGQAEKARIVAAYRQWKGR